MKILDDKLKKLIDFVDDVILVIDKDYNILFVNESINAIVPFNGFVANTKCYTVLFNKINPCENCQLKELSTKESVKAILHDTINLKGIRKLYSATFEKLGDDIFVEVLRDVTDEKKLISRLTYQTKQLKAQNVMLKKSMADIQEKKSFLNVILNSLPIGVVVVNEELKIVELNEMIKSFFEGAKDIKIGDSCFSIYGYDKQCVDCYLKNPYASKTARHENDRHFTIDFHKLEHLLVESSTDTTKVVSLINEIKQKQTELNERQYQMTLLNADLMKANKKLKESQKIIEDELKQVRDIQNSLLPPKLPEIKGYQFAATYIPAEDVGGDYYDYIVMSNNYYGFLVADVSGHGVPAAVIMAITRAILHSYSIDVVSSSEVLTIINDILCDNIYTTDYVTMFYAVLDIDKGVGNYASAGHYPVLFFDKSKMVVEKLKAKGMFLGSFKDATYEEKLVELEEGDILFMYTDGLVDIQNRQDDFYGIDRVISKLIMLNEEHPDDIIKDILADVKEFSEGRTYFDDLTILVIKKGGDYAEDRG